MRRTLVPLLVLFGVTEGHAQLPSPVVVTDPYAETARIETELTSAQAELAEAEARDARSKAELEQLSPRRQHAKDGLRARVRALYKMQHAGYLPFAGGFDAMLTHLARVERLERVIARDVRNVSYLDRRTNAIADEAQTASAALEALRMRIAGLEARKAAIEAELGAQAGEPWLTQPTGYGNLGVAPLPQVTALGSPGLVAPQQMEATQSGFALLRGRLGAPVARALEIRDGVRDDGPGLEFLTSAGTPVMSVAEGRVAYAGVYGSYGRVVILDHGDSFYTVYGGIGALAVHVGDSVNRGTRLGDVGAGPRPSVFFEVRRSTRTLDPRSWTGL